MTGHDRPIDDRTLTPDRGGEPLDIDLALAALLPDLMSTAA
ncbi:hypothetical protein [Pseudonocardia sp. KRD291]|nr:hypothetical protein [Pseudonocardia sp. KRD291]